MSRHRILCVGLIALDIVSTCERFPDEDEDIRAISQEWRTGGNACTNCTLLTQLGMDCEFLGSLSRGVEAEFVCKHLRDRGVRYGSCVRHSDCGTPTSCVTLSLDTGSRTVVHARNNLPELTVSAFENINQVDTVSSGSLFRAWTTVRLPVSRLSVTHEVGVPQSEWRTQLP